MSQAPDPMSDSSVQGAIPPKPSPIARRRVRVWHFIVLPALAMGTALVVSRIVEARIGGQLGPMETDLFHAIRTILISLLMASLIAWLAVHYRRQYEVQLHARALDLEQTRDFLSGIIEGSGEAIVALDADDRVTSWNRAAEAIFGWTSEEMRGQPPDVLLPDDPRITEDRRRMVRLIRAGQIVRDHETIRVRKDGSHVAVRITWSPLYDASASYAGCTAIVLDITVENEMRRRLLERERLAAVGELSAQVAHEIRNPLAGIRGACQVIFSGKEDPDVRREVGHEVLRQIDRLNRTVEDLLQFAKPSSIDPAPTDLNELIDRVWGVLQEDPKIISVKFERRYGSNLPPLEVDAGQIEQVLYNILLNASQVMDYKGSITVTTELGDGDVSIAVQDTGPGISREVADDIFKPFFSTRARGTGLGLAIVKKIVLAHDGRIDAATAPDGGAEFRIVLPVPTAETT
jgi:two-component system sensor histidine kinase AtoS